MKGRMEKPSLETTTTTTTLTTSGVSGNGSNVLDSPDSHSLSSQSTESRLSPRTGSLCSITTCRSQFDVKGSYSTLFALIRHILGC